jgi:hypothetical protein
MLILQIHVKLEDEDNCVYLHLLQEEKIIVRGLINFLSSPPLSSPLSTVSKWTHVRMGLNHFTSITLEDRNSNKKGDNLSLTSPPFY